MKLDVYDAYILTPSIEGQVRQAIDSGIVLDQAQRSLKSQMFSNRWSEVKPDTVMSLDMAKMFVRNAVRLARPQHVAPSRMKDARTGAPVCIVAVVMMLATSLERFREHALEGTVVAPLASVGITPTRNAALFLQVCQLMQDMQLPWGLVEKYALEVVAGLKDDPQALDLIVSFSRPESEEVTISHGGSLSIETSPVPSEHAFDLDGQFKSIYEFNHIDSMLKPVLTGMATSSLKALVYSEA